MYLFKKYDIIILWIWSLTKDRIAELENELAKKIEYLQSLENDTAKGIYLKELKELKL